MKLSKHAKHAILEITFSLSILSGCGCFAGLSAVDVSPHKLFSLHSHQLKRVLIYGSISVGGGLLLAGAGSESFRQVKKLYEEELGWGEQISVYSRCLKCKYFSNNSLLPCAVHPELKEDCGDWVAR
ncbi:hypothetical protein [Iningainema tapete]|uniref:Uncharacterized protein n=1 Tax=Iningainema tapete BLCC-T55 TaxID=2748662 RepID=A0A8J7C5S0_9CYAN|nr:hypothetical protein [Iningainema tapete]MBD2771121.1 hypothetical protein [Iningainema tapete BLCC-T55]